MKLIALPDGSEIEFPDEMSDAQIASALSKISISSAESVALPSPGNRDRVDNPLNVKEPERSLIDKAIDFFTPAPKSVMDGYVAKPSTVPLIEQRGAPVNEKRFNELKKEYELSTPEQREKIKSLPNATGSVFKAIDEQYKNFDKTSKDLPSLRVGDGRAERKLSKEEIEQNLRDAPVNFTDFLSDLADAVTGAPAQVGGAFASLYEGTDPTNVNSGSVTDNIIKAARKEAEANAKRDGAEATLVDFMGIKIDRKDIRNIPQNLSFSLASMASSLLASIPTTAATLAATKNPVASTVAGYGAAGLGGATTAYRMSVNGFMRDFREALDKVSENQRGSKLTNDEFVAIATAPEMRAAAEKYGLAIRGKGDFKELARDYGLHEAGWEALGNMATMGAAKYIFKQAATGGLIKNLGQNLAAGTGSTLVELGGETATQMGQQRVESEAGTTRERPRDWTSVADWQKSFGEVAGPTLLTAGAMQGGAALAGKAYSVYDTPERQLARELQRDVDATSINHDVTADISRTALDPRTYDPTLIDPSQTTRQRTDVGPSAPVRSEMNFTPADSPSAQAGLAPIVVPDPINVNAGGLDVSTDSDARATTGLGGVPGSDQLVGGVGLSGSGVDGTGGIIGADAAGVGSDAQQAVAARGRTGEQPAGLNRPLQRATDADLLARTQAAIAGQENNNANTQPTEQWFGRKGDGYITEADAGQALPGRQRMFPTLDWKVEQMPSGKYRLAGYSQETANVAQAVETQQAETQGQEVPAALARQSSLEDIQQALPDTVLAELAGNPKAASVRSITQRQLDSLLARGVISEAPKLGTPDADAEAGVNVIGNLLNEATGLGQRVVAFNDPGGANGFELSGIAFVNTAPDTNVAAPNIALHEIRHVVERIAAADTKAGRTNTPAQQFTAQLDSIFDDIKDEGKRAYIQNFLYKDELIKITAPAAREARVQELMQDSTGKLRSEMVADFVANRAQDRAFMIDLAKADPKGFESFVKKWLAVIDNLIAKLRGTKTQNSKESAKVDQYVRDANKAKMTVRDALIQFRKGNLGEVEVEQQADQLPVMSKREKLGDFEARTMKDGTTLVYGNADSIRAQIPDDVKGRVTKDGILFTNSAGPRVKAALGGRTTAYSREGAVLDKLPIKDGKYVGAPEKFNTPGKIPTLRKLLRQLADEGAPGRYWYENSGKEVLKMVGGDMQEARKFVALLAIYSPQAKVDANSTFALRAWAQYKVGQPISVKTGSQDRKATEAMQDVDAFWKGEKTGNFFFNLLREIDPSTAGKQGATIDMWMMRAGQYENDAPTSTQYAFMENETNRLAAELGWEPQQVQAAIWVAMKARMENKGVKKMTEASSEKKGWIKFVPGKDGKGKVRVVLNDQKHRDNWLKYSFAHDVTKDDTQQAKFDFGDGLKRHIGQVSFEARPGRTTGVLPGIHNAPYAQQVEFQQAVQKAFLDEQGNDRLAMYLGLLVDNDILVPGVWQSEVSPSTQLGVAMAPAAGGKVIYDKQDKKIITAKEAEAIDPNWKDGDRIVEMLIDPSQAEALNVYTAIAGLVARQEGVGWHRPFYASTKRDANGLDINIGRTINPAEAKDIETAVGKWMADNGHTGWQDRFAFISSPTGIRIVNFGIITNEKLQSDILRVAKSVLPDGDVRVFASSGDMPTNNWKENPNGETYVQRVSAAGRSDVLDWARANLAPRVQAVFNEYSDKYGWGNPGELKFSRKQRDGAGRDQGRSIAPLEGAPVIQGATGPDSRLVEVAEQYARDNGINLRRQAEYVQVDPVRARRIANAYEVMRHAPQDPKVKEAFQNLIDQTIAQYRALESAGYKFYLFDETNDPYKGNPWNAMRELRNDQVMGVFATEAGFGSTNEFNAEDNPLLADTGIKWPYGSVDGKPKRVLANDLFRAAHDAFGHGLEGAGFRAQGEENAWQAHVRLFTGSAVGAITSETRGQNSWLNYGPNAERNQSARVEDTVFADQKTGLMPEWTWTEGRTDDMPAFSQREDRSGISQLAYQGYQIVDTPRVQASRKINGIIKKLDEGKITPTEFELQVRLLADKMANVTATKEANRILTTRERGADIIREKLIAARRRNEVDPETTEFALWALQQNPNLANGLGISVREQPANQKGAAGDYNPAAEVMRVFKGKANAGTAVHEILHHAERMMPAAVQDGIRKEWSKAYSKALAKADEKQRAALEQMLPALAGDLKAQKQVREAFGDGTLDADQHYQLVNPSEYWAVNATDILKRRYDAGSWIGQAKQWLSEMLQKAKGLLGLRSDAPILRGLQAVLDGKGERLSRQMLTTMDRFNDITAPDTPAFKRWFGDSKIVDANGNPLIMYHGTGKDFSTFQKQMGRQFFFSADPEFANEYAKSNGSNVIPAYIKAEKVWDFNEPKDMAVLQKHLGLSDEEIKLPQGFDEGEQYLSASNGEWSYIESRDFQKFLKKNGYDGFYVMDDGVKNLGVFEPSQIKSATGNVGTFDPNNPDIRYSKRQKLSGMKFDMESSNKRDTIRIKLQDDALRMKRVIEAVKKKGGTVGEAQNFYDANTLMPGRVQATIDDFKNDVVKPLLDKAAEYDIDLDELSLYAYAKHAPERNAYIASINKRLPDGGSGMTNVDAAAIISQVAASGKQAEYDDLHQRLMSITSTTRQIMFAEGLITRDEFTAMDGAYENYIPLRGFENVDEETGVARPGVGRGVNVRGKETIRALGRKSKAGDLIENAIRDYERVVMRVEKNDVAKVLLDFVLSNPDPDLWGVDVEKSKPGFNKAQGTVQFTKSIEKGDDTIGLKVGGEQVYIKFADKELSRALRQAWKDETSGLERATLAMTGWWNNWMRAVLTKYNPAFAALNLPKDALWSGPMSALADIGAKGMVKYLAVYPKALMAATRQELGASGTSNRAFGNQQMDALFKEFRSAGGITGGFNMRTVEDIEKELRNDLLQAGAAPRNPWEMVKALPPYKMATLTLKMLEFLGSASENATRFALYAASREMGNSPTKAGVLAKDGTTNFNRKGEWGGALNNMFLFYNAGVQGSAQLLKVMKNPKVQAAMAGVTGIGMMLALYGASAGGEDDDGEAYWDKIPSYVKERNLVIMLPPGGPLGNGIQRVGQRGRYITIPVQYGFNIFPNLGYVMADVFRNQQDKKRGMTPVKAALHMTSTVIGSVNPFGGSVDVTDGVQVLLAVMPTIADLPVQLVNERSTFGSPSAPAKSPFDMRPDSERMFTSQQDTVPAKIAKALNELGGGNEGKTGSVMGVETSVTPGTIDTLIKATTGGLGSFVEQVATSVMAMAGGEPPKANKMPFVNKFYGEVDEDANIRSLSDRIEKIRKISDEVKAQQTVGIDPTLTDDEKKLMALANMQEIYQEMQTEMRKQELAIINSKKLTEPQKKLERQKLQVIRDKTATEMNKEYLKSIGR